MVKIAFGYKQRVGKDTCCDYLIEKYGGAKVSFAEPLYKILKFAQNVCKFEETKDRHFLQFVGTDWARAINESVWVDLLLDKIKNADSHVFVSDLRFQNELRALKRHGFICVCLNKNIDSPDASFQNHQSECDLDNVADQGDPTLWDYTINNSGSLHNLYMQLDQIFLQLTQFCLVTGKSKNEN